jgi:hypothetical protein
MTLYKNQPIFARSYTNYVGVRHVTWPNFIKKRVESKISNHGHQLLTGPVKENMSSIARFFGDLAAEPKLVDEFYCFTQ